MVLVVAFAVASGSVPALGSYLPAFYAILVPITLPILISSLTEPSGLHQAMAVLDVVYIVTMVGLAQRTNENFLESLRLRFDKDALAEKLRVEKERAEEANLAKSRFLASASHDLRQPIHALGMFLGALSSMRWATRCAVSSGIWKAPSMRWTVCSVRCSIFRGSTRGVVQSHPQSFPVDSLLERICRDHMAEAAEKNIRLIYCPSSLNVFTDPILLERILRNIISNAVRYTEQGRVLVGSRRGRRLRIEIWDSGPGIPQDEQDRVFEEFYQLGNPERDRTKGLGLGLAIVQTPDRHPRLPFRVQVAAGQGNHIHPVGSDRKRDVAFGTAHGSSAWRAAPRIDPRRRR